MILLLTTDGGQMILPLTTDGGQMILPLTTDEGQMILLLTTDGGQMILLLTSEREQMNDEATGSAQRCQNVTHRLSGSALYSNESLLAHSGTYFSAPRTCTTRVA